MALEKIIWDNLVKLRWGRLVASVFIPVLLMYELMAKEEPPKIRPWKEQAILLGVAAAVGLFFYLLLTALGRLNSAILERRRRQESTTDLTIMMFALGFIGMPLVLLGAMWIVISMVKF